MQVGGRDGQSRATEELPQHHYLDRPKHRVLNNAKQPKLVSERFQERSQDEEKRRHESRQQQKPERKTHRWLQ